MEIKAYGLNHHPDISSFFDDYGVDNSDDLFDAFGDQAVDIDGVKAVCYYVEDDPDNIEMHILCDYWDHDTIKHTIANFLNSDLCESKKSEAISPKLQLRKKFQAFDNLAKKLAFFRVSGKSAKDWYEGDYDSIGDFYDEESDAKEAAEKVFDDFDEYVDYRVDYDGSASELNYCPVFKFKPEFWELSVNDMSEVLSMLDDALQEYV